ncbi:MAG: SpoIIE family protein phosphatase [bacterium]
MQILNSKRFETLLFFILLGVLVGIDFLFYLNGKFPSAVFYFREALIIAVVVSFIPFLKRSKFVANKEVLSKLKGLYLAVAGIYFIFVVPKILLRPLSGFLRFHDRSNSYLFASVSTFFYGLIISIVTAGMLIGILMILKDLIYYKRKRSSARNFKLLLILIGLEVIFPIIQKNGFVAETRFETLDIPSKILLFLLINLMVINSLRNSWVNYLNKKQKLNCLWLGIPLVSGAIIFEIVLARNELITEYSVSLAIFINSMGLFLCIYLGLGFLSLLLHLPTAGIFDRKIREIESLHDLSRTISSGFDSEQIVKMITNKAAAIINSDALWLEILDSDANKLKVVSSENLHAKEIMELNLDTSNGLHGWIIQNKESVLINEVSRDPKSNDFKIWSKKLGSILGVPLVSQTGVLGILFAGKAEDYSYDEEDRELLQAFANQATIALENARLFKEFVVKERLEQELQVAHDAQSKLLPKRMPNIEGLDIDAISIAANEVGGDYYDFFEVENRLGIAVGDVSGKGAQAAFYMAELKGIIESLTHIYTSPKELLIKVNKTLYGNIERKTFISLIYALIDIKKRELIFTRAGHCPLLHCSNGQGESRFIEPPGLGLGLDKGSKFREVISEQKIKLKSGDVLIFYTDGVTEARNSSKMEFEEERLRKLVSENSHLSSTQIKGLLVKEIKKFVGHEKSHDDLTFVVIKVI